MGEKDNLTGLTEVGGVTHLLCCQFAVFKEADFVVRFLSGGRLRF